MTTPLPPEAALYAGQQFGDYVLEEFINGGSFGVVFSARHVKTGQLVAVKALGINSLRHGRDEFENEDQLLYRLRGKSGVVARLGNGLQDLPVQVHGMSINLSVPFIVLDLAECCLEELLVQRELISWSERLALFRGVVLGVHQIHLSRVVHRDVKSSNCLVFRVAKGFRTALSDFGRSRDMGRPASSPSHSYFAGRGDFRFAPPESLWLQVNESEEAWQRIDVYGIASVLFELATGQGLTGYTLGSGPDIFDAISKMPPPVRLAHYTSQLPDLRSRYTEAFEHFQSSLPPSIAMLGGTLIRQIGDPDPGRRLPPRVNVANGSGLQWLLRRVDILSLTLKKAEIQEAKLKMRKGKTNVGRR